MDATAFCIVYVDQLLSFRSLAVLGPSVQVKPGAFSIEGKDILGSLYSISSDSFEKAWF